MAPAPHVNLQLEGNIALDALGGAEDCTREYESPRRGKRVWGRRYRLSLYWGKTQVLRVAAKGDAACIRVT